jgi:hypothetical protein
MANSSIAQAVTREQVGAALRQARIDCAHSIRWLNAVNRAALDLEACRWMFDGDALKMESASTAGEWYRITTEGCTCKAGQASKPCKHRAAWRLLRKAGELAEQPTPQPRIAPTFIDLQAAADELFS